MKKLFLTFTVILAFAATTFAQLIPNGVYLIKFANSPNYVLTLKDGKAAENNDIVVYERNNSNAQKWKVENTKDGSIIIRSMVDNKYVVNIYQSELKDAAKIVSRKYESAAQKWVPYDMGNNVYVLKVAQNQNLSLDLIMGNANAKNNGQIDIYRTHYGYEQHWIFEKVDK